MISAEGLREKEGKIMRSVYLLILLVGFGFSPVAIAGLLQVSLGTREIEGVKISQEAKATVAERSYALKTVGAGLRSKKVAFFKAKVYVGELLLDAPEKFQPTLPGALPSVDLQKALAMRLTFLREVEGEKVSRSFRDALEENQVNLESPEIKAFLAAVPTGGEAKEKSTLVIFGERFGAGKESVSFEGPNGKLVTIPGGTGFVRSVFSIWLGKMADSGLEHLKNEILGVKE